MNTSSPLVFSVPCMDCESSKALPIPSPPFPHFYIAAIPDKHNSPFTVFAFQDTHTY